MADNVSEQKASKLEELTKQRFTPEGKSERMTKALAALRHEQPIRLSLEDWKWVAEEADLADRGLAYNSRSGTLNLMLGLAGIGYAILRPVDPERVPSTLLLEPPRLAEGIGNGQPWEACRPQN